MEKMNQTAVYHNKICDDHFYFLIIWRGVKYLSLKYNIINHL